MHCLFFLILSFMPFTLLAQTESNASEYCRFVQKDKRWHVLEFAIGGEQRFSPRITDFYFGDATTAKDGKAYITMYATSEGQTSHVGLFREENGKVYQYQGTDRQDAVLYDFTLNPGDKLADAASGWDCTVTDISSIESNGHPLRVIHLQTVYSNNEEQHETYTTEWVEGIGTLSSPIQYFDDLRNSSSHSSQVAYAITDDGSLFLPLTFGVPWNGWRGTQLTTSGIHDAGADELEYKLDFNPVRDSYDLNVSGRMNMPSGPNNYIYAIDTYSTESLTHHVVTFHIEALPPYSDETTRQEVYVSFPFFSEGIDYIYTNPSTHISTIQAPQIINSKSVNRKCFDLSGRHLAAPPARGLYIEDGKVRVK